MNELFERVVHVLAPFLGQATAESSVKMFLAKSQLTPASVRTEHLVDLANRIKPGLAVFVGGAKADILARKIREIGGKDSA